MVEIQVFIHPVAFIHFLCTTTHSSSCIHESLLNMILALSKIMITRLGKKNKIDQDNIL